MVINISNYNEAQSDLLKCRIVKDYTANKIETITQVNLIPTPAFHLIPTFFLHISPIILLLLFSSYQTKSFNDSYPIKNRVNTLEFTASFFSKNNNAEKYKNFHNSDLIGGRNRILKSGDILKTDERSKYLLMLRMKMGNSSENENNEEK